MRRKLQMKEVETVMKMDNEDGENVTKRRKSNKDNVKDVR